jgi:SAM-dependent methyltransferase
MMRKLYFERLVRQIVPSLSLFSYGQAIRRILDVADIPLSSALPEFKALPPNHLRVRVGVGNRLFNNQMLYFGSKHHWFFAFASGWADLTSSIVELGCGCGRHAHELRDFNYAGETFRGRYVGVDIDNEALAWCRKKFDPDRFEFLQSTDGSKSYRQSSNGKNPYAIPLGDSTADYVFSNSLFTHLLEPQLNNYLRESIRLLKPGRVMAHSVFCIDYPPAGYGNRYTFSQRIGNAFIESRRIPEAAVAYTEKLLLACASAAGAEAPKLLRGPATLQPILFARKPM